MDQANIFREVLECPLCNELYNENSRAPRVLPCFHPFCSVCLKKQLKNSSIVCSFCRKSHDIVNNDVTTLGKDLTLMNIIGKMAKKCDCCEEDADAVSYCEACQEYMCRMCAEAHGRFKKLKDHTLRNLNSTPLRSEPSEVRKTHSKGENKSETSDAFCTICDKPVVRKDHAHQNLINIEDFVKGKKKQLQQLVSEIDGLRTNKELEISRLTDKCNKDIQLLKGVINKKMEDYTRVLETRCTALQNEAESKMAIIQKYLLDISKKRAEAVDANLTEARRLVNLTDEMEFLQGFDDVNKRLTETHNMIKNSVQLKELHFIQTCSTDNFQQIVDGLGILVERNVDTKFLGSPNVANGNNVVEETSNDTPEVADDTRLLEHEAVPFMNVLKSLLNEEPINGNERLLEASGGPEIDNQCYNTTRDKLEINDADLVGMATLEDLKELPDGYKTVKECIPHGKLEVIKTNTVRQMVLNRFETFKLNGNWRIEGDMVTVWSTTDTNAETCMEILVESVLEEMIALPAGSEIIVDTDKWVMMNSRLNRKYKDQVKLQVLHDKKCVGVYATCTSALKDACDNARIFLRDNLLKSIVLEFPEENGEKMTKFIFRQKSRLNKIHESWSHYFVSVRSMTSTKILIKGIGLGLCMAVKMVHEIAKKYNNGDGDDEEERFSDNDENDDNIDDRFSDDDDDDDTITNAAASGGSPAFNSVNLPIKMTLLIAEVPIFLKSLCFHGDDKVIFVVGGDITMLPVEAVVNPSNQSLKHDGGVSKALVQKGGMSIQEECRNHVERNGKLTVGSIYCSRSGLLPFSVLIHAVGPKWIDGKHEERGALRKLVMKCLHAASRKQLASVALPAMGTGANKFPVSESTSTVVEAIKQFLTENPLTSLHEIYLCHVTMDIVEEFHSSLCKHYDKKDIVLSFARQELESHQYSSKTAVPPVRDAVMRNLFI